MLRSALRVAKPFNSSRFRVLSVVALLLAAVAGLIVPRGDRLAHAQAAGPTMLVPNLGVRTVATGLTQPTNMAFLGAADAFVIEKSTGRVLYFANAGFRGVALDLSVNASSERGL